MFNVMSAEYLDLHLLSVCALLIGFEAGESPKLWRDETCVTTDHSTSTPSAAFRTANVQKGSVSRRNAAMMRRALVSFLCIRVIVV